MTKKYTTLMTDMILTPEKMFPTLLEKRKVA